MPDNQTIGRSETSKVGKRGTVVVPARLRRRFGIEEGSLVIAEEREDGILIRPAVAYAVEIYTPERKAEFLLSNAVDEEDYQKALKAVREMGIDPDRIEHYHLDQIERPKF
jgi:AbrB family looped-hinge helix DNA binding protein